jgi:tryptophanyl-tRNA synthetase
VGLRSLASSAGPAKRKKAVKSTLPSFKQYRENDGKFYFKLVDAQGNILQQSQGFDTPKQAAQAIALLKEEQPEFSNTN